MGSVRFQGICAWRHAGRGLSLRAAPERLARVESFRYVPGRYGDKRARIFHGDGSEGGGGGIAAEGSPGRSSDRPRWEHHRQGVKPDGNAPGSDSPCGNDCSNGRCFAPREQAPGWMCDVCDARAVPDVRRSSGFGPVTAIGIRSIRSQGGSMHHSLYDYQRHAPESPHTHGGGRFGGKVRGDPAGVLPVTAVRDELRSVPKVCP